MTACSCAQAGATGLDHLDMLINDLGWDQVAACRALWSGDLGPSLEWARARAGEIVREGLADVLAWLRAAGVPA